MFLMRDDMKFLVWMSLYDANLFKVKLKTWIEISVFKLRELFFLSYSDI